MTSEKLRGPSPSRPRRVAASCIAAARRLLPELDQNISRPPSVGEKLSATQRAADAGSSASATDCSRSTPIALYSGSKPKGSISMTCRFSQKTARTDWFVMAPTLQQKAPSCFEQEGA